MKENIKNKTGSISRSYNNKCFMCMIFSDTFCSHGLILIYVKKMCIVYSYVLYMCAQVILFWTLMEFWKNVCMMIEGQRSNVYFRCFLNLPNLFPWFWADYSNPLLFEATDLLGSLSWACLNTLSLIFSDLDFNVKFKIKFESFIVQIPNSFDWKGRVLSHKIT